MIEALILSAVCGAHQVQLPPGEYAFTIKNECGAILSIDTTSLKTTVYQHGREPEAACLVRQMVHWDDDKTMLAAIDACRRDMYGEVDVAVRIYEDRSLGSSIGAAFIYQSYTKKSKEKHSSGTETL